MQHLDAEEFDQPRLPDQDDFEELLRPGLEVRQQADLLERADAQILGFVDDQDRASPAGPYGLQMGVERVDEDRLAVRGALVLHAKLVADGEEELRFEAGDVIERVTASGDLFAPVLTLEQELPRPS